MRTSTSQASERPGPRPAVGIQAYRMCLRGQSVELVTERSNGPDRLIDLNARRAWIEESTGELVNSNRAQGHQVNQCRLDSTS